MNREVEHCPYCGHELPGLCRDMNWYEWAIFAVGLMVTLAGIFYVGWSIWYAILLPYLNP